MLPIQRRSPTADLARGAGSLLASVALLIGVPWALAAAVGWPLPRGVPSVEEVSQALRDGYLPDGTLVKALALVLWLIWVQLAVAFVLEAIAVARGRHAGTVPVAGGIHKLAGRLVAGITLLGVLSATRGVPIPLPVERPVSVGSTTATMTAMLAGVDKQEVAAAPAAADLPVYEVQRRDTLWDIAERHLGDPFRWPEIYELNCNVPQADGRQLVDADLILPGWQLQLPADAQGDGLSRPSAPKPEESAPAEVAAAEAADPVKGELAAVRGEPGTVMVRLDDADASGVDAAGLEVVLETETIAEDSELMVRLPDPIAEAAGDPADRAAGTKQPGPSARAEP